MYCISAPNATPCVYLASRQPCLILYTHLTLPGPYLVPVMYIISLSTEGMVSREVNVICCRARNPEICVMEVPI